MRRPIDVDWNATSGPGAILNKPPLFPTQAHTHPMADISALQAALDSKLTIPTGTASQYVRGDGTLATTPTEAQTSVTRALNTIFQISTTRNAMVWYSVQMTITATVTAGQNGDIILEIASNAAFTTAVQTVGIGGYGQTYTLAAALQGVQPNTFQLSGMVPAGMYARLRTVSNTGTPTFAYRAGQEVLM